MFSGIVKGILKVKQFNQLNGIVKLTILFSDELLKDLKIGASVSVNGVCLTVVKIENNFVDFDLIEETLKITNLKFLKVEDDVNIERSLLFGDEIGGHLISGHVFGTAEIVELEKSENNHILTLQVNENIKRYLLKKGFIALNGASLTIVDVDKQKSTFTVHLIPETLRQTTFSKLGVKDLINVEIDQRTQALIDSLQQF